MGIDGLESPYEFDPQEDPEIDDLLQPWPSKTMGRYVHDLTPPYTWVILRGTTAA
jgi:hypothetical protein